MSGGKPFKAPGTTIGVVVFVRVVLGELEGHTVVVGSVGSGDGRERGKASNG